jgi:hypothetical protein
MRPGANESAAIATLKNLAVSQEQFRMAGYLDRDGDGVGEFGTMRELGGEDSGRLTTAMSVPLVSRGMIPKEAGGRFLRSGYYFQLYLPDGPQGWTLPRATSLCDAGADDAEQQFLVLAWPASFDETGKRCFFVDGNGTVKAAKNDDWKFSGETKVPSPTLTTLPVFVTVR